MEITWIGHAGFRLRSREATVVTDPFQKRGTVGPGRLAADVVTISHDHPGHNNAAAVSGQPRIIRGPGEYEVKSIFITGIRTFHDSEKGKRLGKNTAYLYEMDEMIVCHLGDLGHILTSEQVEQMSNVDVLLVPVGGNNTLNAAQAAEVISLIEPRVVIPMHYREGEADGELDPLDKFLREMSVADGTPQLKATLSKSTLPDQTDVVVLEPRRG